MHAPKSPSQKNRRKNNRAVLYCLINEKQEKQCIELCGVPFKQPKPKFYTCQIHTNTTLKDITPLITNVYCIKPNLYRPFESEKSLFSTQLYYFLEFFVTY